MNRVLPTFALSCALMSVALPAPAQEARGVLCVAGSSGQPARVVSDCDALLADTATPDAQVVHILLDRAEPHVRQGRPQEAIADVDTAIKRSPTEARLFAHRAELYRW